MRARGRGGGERGVEGCEGEMCFSSSFAFLIGRSAYACTVVGVMHCRVLVL